ncbi:MAG: oligosaccharide flippase family protein [Bacteroidales bacterium]|jgi:O-antigen/teichoic acid export membrane protein|nr:oligosaccharide flippase family protein [Bacteroidales bacterium]
MKRLFLTNLAFLLLLNVFIKAFWILGIDRGVQNAVSSDDYGLYFALLNFTYVFNVFLDVGLTNWNNRQIAQHAQLLPKYFARLIPMKIILALGYTIIIFAAALIAGKTSEKEMSLLLWLCVCQILLSLVLYLRSNISGLLMFKTDSVLSVLDRFLMVVICGVLLWSSVLKGRGFKIEYFVYAQVASYSVTALIAAGVCLYKTGFMRLKWNFPFLLKVLKDCFPYALLTLMMSFYNRIDSVMLLHLLKDGEVASAIYAAGFRLVDSANMISYLFSIILLPLFANMIKSKIAVNEVVKSAFHLLITLSAAFVIISQFYAADIMHLMYNKEVSQSTEVFRILSFCFVPISMTYIFGTLLTANGSLRKLNIVAFCGMVSNVGIDLLLIPHFNVLGATYASLFTQSFTALLQIFIALRLFKIQINYRYAVKIVAYLASLVAIAFLVKQMALSWLWLIVITAALYVVAAFAFRIFSIKGFFLFINNK